MMVTSNVRLLRPLGEGGMGAVWLAEHLSLRTNVVVKFMAEDLAKSTEAKARFSREAAAASQVKSPHVVQMFDHGVLEGGAPYIVMELLEGRDLEQQLKVSKRLEPREVVAIIAQLARALGRAHERAIVHRDIKPSNVFLCDAGGGELFVKLLDFGIAKGQEIGIAGSTTRTGSFIGSPYYMSPEQVIGAKDIDFRTDLWSLGVVAYEALTGQKPFHAETVGALALKIHRDPLPVPSTVLRALGTAVDEWFLRACAREPAGRFASAKEMADALALAVTGESMPPGLRVDAVPTPRVPVGLQTTLPGPAGARDPSGIDARSETGAGVGLVATDRVPISSRGKWLAVGGIALVAVGIGFAVPRMMAKTDAVTTEPKAAASVRAASSATTVPPGPTGPAGPTGTVEMWPLDEKPTAVPTAPTAAATTVAVTIHPGTAAPRPRPSASSPAPSATAAPPPPATATATAKTQRGSDDDIK
jgi:serine/threonine protein kinase